jgi:hypothetical protein
VPRGQTLARTLPQTTSAFSVYQVSFSRGTPWGLVTLARFVPSRSMLMSLVSDEMRMFQNIVGATALSALMRMTASKLPVAAEEIWMSVM